MKNTYADGVCNTYPISIVMVRKHNMDYMRCNID